MERGATPFGEGREGDRKREREACTLDLIGIML